VIFLYLIAFDVSVRGRGPCRSIAMFWYAKTRMMGLPDGEKNFEDMYNSLDKIPA